MFIFRDTQTPEPLKCSRSRPITHSKDLSPETSSYSTTSYHLPPVIHGLLQAHCRPRIELQFAYTVCSKLWMASPLRWGPSRSCNPLANEIPHRSQGDVSDEPLMTLVYDPSETKNCQIGRFLWKQVCVYSCGQ